MKWCTQHRRTYRGFACMEQAYRKTQNACGSVNSVLLFLLQLANEGQLLSLAYQTIKHIEIAHEQSSGASMHSMDVYNLLLLGGHSCLGVKDYTKAYSMFLSAFHVGLTIRMEYVSSVLRYLYLLANLVGGVDVPSSARHDSAILTKANEQCHAYRMFHEVFGEQGVPELYALCVAHRDAFVADGMMSLVEACLVRKVVHCVERMSKTHVTVPLENLPIEDLAKIQEEGEETISLLERLILSGELRATLDREKGSLTFFVESTIVVPAKEISHLLGRIKAGHSALDSAHEVHRQALQADFVRRGAADVATGPWFQQHL
jgi:hypothetical protein